MKKLFSIMLMTTLLFISGNVWGGTYTASSADELKTAVNAAKTGDVVQLTANIDLGANTFLIDKSGIEFTLDLNGHNLKGSKCTETTGIIRVAHGTMTIMTSQPGGSIGVEKVSQFVLNVSGGGYDGTVILQSGTIYGQNKVVNISAGSGKFIMEGGAIVVDGPSTASVFGLFLTSKTGSAEINGGTISVGVSTNDVTVAGISNAGSLAIYDVEMYIHNTGTSSKDFAFTYNVNGTEIINGGKFVANGSTTSLSNTFFVKTTKIFGGKFDCDVQAWIPAGEPYMCQANAGLGTCFGQTLTHEVVENPAATACVRNVTQSKDYTSISKALAEAAELDELCLLKNLDFAQASLTVNRAITLDLNGQNLWGNTSAIYLTGGEDEGHTLVLTDKAADKGLIKGSSPIQLNGGYVKVENVVVNGTSCAINQAADGNYTIQNVEAVVKSLAKNASVYKVATATTVIKDCNFTLDAANIPTGSSSSTYNSVFSGTTGALSINGGEYKVINLRSGDYAGIFYGTASKNIVSIYDGKFSVECDNMTNARISNATASTKIITLQIYGGKFNINPTTWLAPGYVANLTDGVYTVAEGNVASVNGEDYKNLDEAIAAAKTTSAPITLLHSTKLTTTLNIPAGVTFASTSYTIELLHSTPLRLEEGAVIPTCVSNTNFVASISESNATRYFYSLSKGISACEETETVKLLQDVTETISLLVGTKTIDFNGHKLSSAEKILIDVTTGMTGAGANLTLKNSSATVSVLENTYEGEGQYEGLHLQSKGAPATVTIGSGVTIKANTGVTLWKGVTLNVYGKIISKVGFAIAGNGSTGNGGTTINIYEGAEVKSPNTAIYHPQAGTLNVYGGLMISDAGSTIEMRAGSLNIKDGEIINNLVLSADDSYAGNGTATRACAVAVAQHTTELPITVNISGGEYKAYTPLYQGDAMQNGAKDVKISVTNGKFTATSNNIVWSENELIAIEGGLFNKSPEKYVAAGKTVVPNTDPATKNAFPYTIGKVSDEVLHITDGNWSGANSTTKVSVESEVAITGVAEAYSIDITAGSKLTLRAGAKLFVGAGGLTNTSVAQLVIESGAALLISPAATGAAAHPFAECHLETVIRDVTADWNENPALSDYTYDHIWQNVAIPVTSVDMSPKGQTYINKWDVVNGWLSASSLTEFPAFRGMHITATTTAVAGDYHFDGKLVGNDNAQIVLPRDGFHLVGNSWTAPLDVNEILTQIANEEDAADLSACVYMYIPDNMKIGGRQYNEGTYVSVTRESLKSNSAFAEIAPMTGYFVFTDGATTIDLNYEKAAWNAQMAARELKTAARENDKTAATIILTAENGRTDYLSLYVSDEYSAEKDEPDAVKFMNELPNVNVYITTPLGNLSSMATNNVDTTYVTIATNAKQNYTFTFDDLKGNDLYLTDVLTNTTVHMTADAEYAFQAEPLTTISDRFFITMKSSTATGIENVALGQKGGIYTIFGQYVGSECVWSELPSGLYIVNGEKKVK